MAAAIAIVGLLAFCRDDVFDLLGLARGTFTSVFGATRKQAAAVT